MAAVRGSGNSRRRPPKTLIRKSIVCQRIGFEGRFDYSAISSVVNLAARLCGEADAGQILVDRKVFMAIEELADVEQAGELNLKGFHRPVVAYDVRSLRL